MRKIILLYILLSSSITFTQSITNKLGRDDQLANYTIKNSSDELLFNVNGEGYTTVYEILSVDKIIHIDWNSQGVPNGGTVNPNASYIRLYYSGLPGLSVISLSSSNAIDDGKRIGQILYLEIQGISPWINIPNGANTSIGEDRLLLPDDIVQLIWNGTVWVMPNI